MLTIAEKLGANVRTRRQKLQLSQEDLAEASGLHRTYVGSVERGERNVSLENIVLIAEALGCNAADLLEGVRGKGAE